MPKRAWIERDAPLAACPLPSCRRGRTCRHATDRDPCRRLHQSRESFYLELAIKIDRITAQIIAERPPGLVVPVAEPGSPLFERRHKQLYDALRAADEAGSAAEMAALARKKKPATGPYGT